MNPLKVSRKQLLLSLVESEIVTIKNLISNHVKPSDAFLFGSAAEGRMSDQSDYDLLLVFDSKASMKMGKVKFKNIRGQLPKRPFDVLWYLKGDFERKKAIGGVAMIAANEGLQLLRKMK